MDDRAGRAEPSDEAPALPADPLQALLEGSPLPMLVVGEHGLVVRANRPARALVGAAPAGLAIGVALRCVNADGPGGCGHQGPCEGCGLRAALRDAAGGQPVRRRAAPVHLRDAAWNTVEAEVRLTAARWPGPEPGCVVLTVEAPVSEPPPAPRHVPSPVAELGRQLTTARTLLDAAPVALMVKDGDGRFVIVNRAAAVLLGRPAEEVLGRITAELFGPGDVLAAGDEDRRVLETGERLEVVRELEGLPGGRRTVRVDKSRTVAANGELLVIATATDVTDQVRSREALAESERRHRLLADHVHDVLWTLDPATGRFTYVSPSVRRLRGLGVEEALAEPLSSAFTPESLARLQALQARAGLPGGLGPPHGEPALTDVYDQPCRDGAVKHVEITTTAITDAGGRLVEVLGVGRDVTARVRAERAEREGRTRLEESLATLRGILDGSQAAVFSVDRAYRYTSFNRAHAAFMRALYGTEVRLGRPLAEVQTVEEDWDLARRNLDRALAGEAFTEEARSGRSALRRASFEVTHHPIRDLAGAIIGAAVFARDVTDQRSAEAALRQSEANLRQAQKLEAVGRLAGGVAHDFNNMLSVILSSAGLALGEGGVGGDLREDLEAIRDAAERARALTRQLLAFSRRQVLEPRVVDVNALVTGLEGMLRRIVGEDVELRTTLAEGLGRVEVDPGQLEQVIVNLVVNARDAMPRGGHLGLSTADLELDAAGALAHPGCRPGAYVRLEVSDDGVGMDQATQARVFEPFFTTKGPGTGTGLGLATVYGVVQQSGGSVAVRSEPGRGATFTVLLPRVALRPAAEEPAKAGPPAPEGRGETLLVVEDDDAVRRAVVRVLERLGYRVLKARGLEEAVAAVRRAATPPQLLLTDVVMPGGTGLDVAQAVVRLIPEVRVVFMSGYSDEAVRQHGVLAPGVRLVQKPFSPDSLGRRVREALDDRPRRRPPPPEATP